ncbi:lipopolysaccharide kinase InaA family protein [Alcanivorax sp.]|uniref:lipopolysaccharide kinase InaA family protein n=1 Tax=Alcanivorax sp. TaxID=1872427 RepID=UPI0025BF7886|nr:lipopolysaccharide kinase InaA family protein [Alcanivorax sp.]
MIETELSASYVHPHWRQALQGCGLTTIDDWLALDRTLVDKPNRRGRGLSQVFSAVVTDPDGVEKRVYIKHQRNYVRRSVRHPFRGQATLYQEYKAMMRCWQMGVPVVEPLFFSANNVSGDREAMLVSLGLENFQSLDRAPLHQLPLGRRLALIRDVAAAVRLLHEQGLAHQNLYPKHVFVAWSELLQRYDARFIDLERCRPHYQHWRPRVRDLESLARRTKGLSDRDRLRFLREYLAQPLGGAAGRSLLDRLERKFKDKVGR